MAILERDVVLQGVQDGQQTMDFPVTRLGLVEDTAPVKAAPVSGDYIPIMDSADGGQMKKAPVSALTAALGLKAKIFQAGTDAPADTGLLWIDTTATTGGLKYHNGTAWVHVPVAYT